MISLYISLFFNLLLLIGLIAFWRKNSGTSAKPQDLTKDANQLLAELLQGGAVCVTQIIDPEQIFYYSPKDRQ